MQLPEPLLVALRALRTMGSPRLVGGCVRDWLLGLEPKDFDVEVPGVTFEQLHRALASFGSTDVVGRSFGVIKLRVAETEYDFSLPRRESKTGAGHRGFAVEPEPNLTDAEAAARRDFTVNAIAYDPFAETVIDPHNGVHDLRARVLRHTSAAFTEDPLRVLRGFQLAARFNFTLAPETVALCRSISGTFHELPVERIWGEWAKWAEKSTHPSRGLAVLEETGWLAHFPEIAALRGTQQDPEWHPEGDVFTHTAHCCDALVCLEAWRNAPADRRRQLLFAVLAHDFGKPSTTSFADRRGQLRWISPGHESAGGPLAASFLTRIGAPRELIAHVRPLVVLHLAHHSGQGDFSDSRIRRLARKLAPATIDELCIVMHADHDGRPPLHSPETLARIAELQSRATALALTSSAPRPILLGRHLIALGLSPGPDFKKTLDAAFEAQLDGAFSNETDALVWLKNHLPAPPSAR
ncbi:polynucleotide adenylyltransferase [Nibricoccus aquaticus]|uniref:Polynucleotide adenylyltransferase n=2 Tax=Nibricoccus aquaticus TaxID=2576891 RepID=A0A290QI65_9BACT|nr:polynucleotide adenylyltransferase [Nibricoccus aquaticus]